MNSTGLLIFQRLCELGNALEMLRDMFVPESDQWIWHTEILAMLDETVDFLVYSDGLEDDDNAC